MAIPPNLAPPPRAFDVTEPRSLPEPCGLHRLSIGPPVQSGSTPDLREVPDDTSGTDVSPSLKWRRNQGDDRGRFSLSAALGATLGRSNSKRGRDGDRAKDESGRTTRTPSVSPQVRRRDASPRDKRNEGDESMHAGAVAGPRSPGQPRNSNESERLGGDSDGPEGDHNAHQRGKAKTWMKTALKAITRYEGCRGTSCCRVCSETA